MPPTAAASTCRVPPPSGFVAHLAARVRHCSARCGHLCSMAGRSIRYQDVRPCWFLWPQCGTSWLKRLNDLSAPRLTFRDPQQMFSLRNGRTTGASPRARGSCLGFRHSHTPCRAPAPAEALVVFATMTHRAALINVIAGLSGPWSPRNASLSIIGFEDDMAWSRPGSGIGGTNGVQPAHMASDRARLPSAS